MNSTVINNVPSDKVTAEFADTNTALAIPAAAAVAAKLNARNGQILCGDGTWPFSARIDGADIVVEEIVITCFGGAYDPQDDGQTASGVNTKASPSVEGVSIAMDGRKFRMSPKEHAALDGSPLPKVPWHTMVEVTIDGVTHTPKSGILDLGPGKQASSPGEAHALDLTVAAARLFRPDASPKALARSFKARGSFRIIGGAKYV